MNAFVHSQEIVWEKEEFMENKIRNLESEINLQVERKNKLEEWLEIYRKSPVLYFPQDWGTLRSQKTNEFLQQHSGELGYNGHNPSIVFASPFDTNDFPEDVERNCLDLTMFGNNVNFGIFFYRKEEEMSIIYKGKHVDFTTYSGNNLRNLLIPQWKIEPVWKGDTSTGYHYTKFNKSKRPLNYSEEALAFKFANY